MAAMAVARIYADEDQTWHGQSLHRALIEEARKRGLPGATVLRGIEGYGPHHRRIHTARLIDFSPSLPVVVEIVDEEERLRAFIAEIAPMLGTALITLHAVEVLAQPGAGPAGAPS